MMTKLSTIAAISAVLFCGSVFSAPVGNLKVAGDIKPPVCVINEGNNDIVFDFGKIAPTLIKTARYNLPSIINSINVACDAETYLTFKAEDIYTTSSYPGLQADNALEFGLVNAADTSKEVGAIAYLLRNPTVDGQASGWSTGNNGASNNSFILLQTLIKGATVGWTSNSANMISPSSFKLIPGKMFSIEVANEFNMNEYRSFILPEGQLGDISNGIDYVGQALLTFNFGI